MKKVEMYYHDGTNTHWVNDLNWEERHLVESIGYGNIEMKTKDIDKVASMMYGLGFYRISNESVPWGNLGKIKEDMIDKECEYNIFKFGDDGDDE